MSDWPFDRSNLVSVRPPALPDLFVFSVMSSGRHPGDFWCRAPGFLPPGALTEEELNLHRNDVSDVEEDLKESDVDEADEESLGETPIKRPSARPKAVAKVLKRPSARSFKEDDKDKVKEKPMGPSSNEEVTVESDKTKSKPKPKHKAKNTRVKTKTKAVANAKAKPEKSNADSSKPMKRPASKAPPGWTPDMPGCSKCRWKGCRACRGRLGELEEFEAFLLNSDA